MYFIQIVILNFPGFNLTTEHFDAFILHYYQDSWQLPNKNSASHHVKTKIDVALNQLNLPVILCFITK